jgi:hypothetical protein
MHGKVGPFDERRTSLLVDDLLDTRLAQTSGFR